MTVSNKLGSARQLFQRLQGPMEEDTLKSHFDKIIKIGQKQRYHRNQAIVDALLLLAVMRVADLAKGRSFSVHNRGGSFKLGL
ncbi:hypothetical protein JHK86_050454 [Glycine max]|nr:hypothetical protein JHK86_050454 [Glycine max]